MAASCVQSSILNVCRGGEEKPCQQTIPWSLLTNVVVHSRILTQTITYTYSHISCSNIGGGGGRVVIPYDNVINTGVVRFLAFVDFSGPCMSFDQKCMGDKLRITLTILKYFV